MIIINTQEDIIKLFDSVNTILADHFVVHNTNTDPAFLTELIIRCERCLHPGKFLHVYTYIPDMSFPEQAALSQVINEPLKNIKIYFYSTHKSFTFCMPRNKSCVPYISLKNDKHHHIEFLNKCLDAELREVVFDIQEEVDEEIVINFVKICLSHRIHLFFSNKKMDLDLFVNSKYAKIYERAIDNFTLS